MAKCENMCYAESPEYIESILLGLPVDQEDILTALIGTLKHLQIANNKVKRLANEVELLKVDVEYLKEIKNG